MTHRTARLLAVVLLLLFGCRSEVKRPASSTPPPSAKTLPRATFAGGCFWCMEPPFERLPGVVWVTAGYTGGTKVNPTYGEVSHGGTGHRESVEVIYDPKRISYAQLLDVYWHNVDPTDDLGQFCDHGMQYTTAIFVHDETQKQLAAATKEELQKRMTVVTEILPAGPFYPAEEYHQDYAKKNPLHYKFYRSHCGRDKRLAQLWGAAPSH